MKNYHICFFVLIIAFSSCFNLFEKEQRLLAKVDISSQCKVEAILINTGATTEDAVQIKIIANEKSKIITTYKSYNWAQLVKLSGDTLIVKLSDTMSIPNYIDTQYITVSCN